jgi:hypothetical protein
MTKKINMYYVCSNHATITLVKLDKRLKTFLEV